MIPEGPSPPRSALYEGTVAHRRVDPVHRFAYRVALPLLYLDELTELSRVHPLVELDPSGSRPGRPFVMRLRREDFLGPVEAPLDAAVRQAVVEAGGAARGPIALLGHLRTWGWLFNPLTVYYCFDPAGDQVEWTVLEVSNTPWHERHTYVVGPPGRHRLEKALHVSPFLPMDAEYALSYSPPGASLALGIDVHVPASPLEPLAGAARLSASMVLERRPLDRKGLSRLLLRYPFMATRVSAGIYGQALRLTCRRARFYPHPPRPGARQ